MAPAFTIALQIASYLAKHKDEIAALILSVQELLSDTPGNSRFKVVADTIREAIDTSDPDDKTWEKAWLIIRPLFDAYVAKVKGKVLQPA